jgi:hypothetical protein
VRAEGNEVGIGIVGDGNEVRSSNGVRFSAALGIEVIGSKNVLSGNRVDANAGPGIRVTGDENVVKTNKVGDATTPNAGHGIEVEGAGNVVKENDVFANAGAGILIAGDNNSLSKNDVGEAGKGNAGVGIHVTGDGNMLGEAVSENNVFANGADGIVVIGNYNTIYKNDVGDKNKGNAGNGITMVGYANKAQENRVYANAGNGIEASGGTGASPNVIYKNTVGDKNKGNLGRGVLVGGTGNGNASPVEINQNTVRSNALQGIKVTGTGHQLKSNVSGGSGAYPGGYDNGLCEYEVAAGNFNATGNKANGTTISGTSGSAFPTGCKGTP